MAIAKKRATIKDVAALADVSYQTVSRVINNHPSVNNRTRDRVQQAISELDYRPNQAARSLSRRRSHIIGLIVPYHADYLFRDPHLLAQISGIDAEANAHSYNLLLSTASGSDSGIEAYERFVRNQVADGALVVETSSLPGSHDLLTQQDYPYIVLGYNLNNQIYSIHVDDVSGAYQATQHLLKKGHRRIGVIDGPPTGAVVGLKQRMEGHRKALAEAEIALDPTLVVHGDYSRLSGQKATDQLLALPEPPTAIFSLNDRMAMGAIWALTAAGLRVPEDVAVVGFDDIPAAADFNPSLTTVRQPSKEIGRVATQTLFELIDGEQIDRREQILPAELVIRQSS